MYKTGNLGTSLVYDFLVDIDIQFIPPLSLRVNLMEYAEKLSTKSTFIYYVKSNKIIGLIAFYENQNTIDFAYISLICILKDSQAKGIGTNLLKKCITYLKIKKFHSVKLEVDSENINALSFYSKFGFHIQDKKKESLVLLKTLS